MSRYRWGPKLNGLGVRRQWASPEAHGGRGAADCSPLSHLLTAGTSLPALCPALRVPGEDLGVGGSGEAARSQALSAARVEGRLWGLRRGL